MMAHHVAFRLSVFQLTLGLFLLAVIPVWCWAKQDTDERELFTGGLDIAVTEVATGGYWRDGERSGRYRIVVFAHANEHINTTCYAQWLSYDPSSNKKMEFLTTPLRPLNDLILSVVVDVRFVYLSKDKKDNQAVAELTLRQRYTFKEKVVRVLLGAPGHYEVRGL